MAEEIDQESYRAFGGIDDHDEEERKTYHSPHHSSHTHDQHSLILQSISENIIGENVELPGPYGPRPCVYADWTASGRLLQQVESYLTNEVYPLYGNTHSSASRTGHQSTSFRHESRQIIAEAVNAHITGRAAVDMVIFTGNGTTSAVNKLVHCLGLHLPLPEPSDISLRPVVFTSSYEHHSNLLPWRECEVDVVTIRLSRATGVCLNHLAECLQKFENRKLKIGAFSAASNVTGLLTDVNSVSILMHKAGGLAFFDYATAAPYVKIDMNPVLANSPDAPFAHKDAVYFSGHKFVGGPGSSGVLIAKKRIIPSSKEPPSFQGGGTVFYVTDDHHRYLSNRVEREEAGTPGIIGDIRIGLAFRLKQLVGPHLIHECEMRIASTVHSRLLSNPAIHLLGHPRDLPSEPTDAKHLPLISFLIQPSGSSRLLHHNFVSALLNDLFGIQSRGGCMCAGPYSQWILGLCDAVTPFNSDEQQSSCCPINDSVENALLDKQEVLRPGFTRLSFPYFTPDDKVEYILKAIEFVAEYGVLFLQYYRFNGKTGEWAHSTRLTKFPERKWLTNFNILNSQQIQSDLPKHTTFSPQSYHTFLSQAHEEALKILELNQKKVKKFSSKGGATAGESEGDQQSLTTVEALRWFILPTDFPGSAPVIELNGPYVALELKGAIRPNGFFYETTHPGNNKSLVGHGERSPYIEKRDQKLVSSLKLTKQPPRYLSVDHLLGTSSSKHLPLPSLALSPKEIKAEEESEPATKLPVNAASPPSSPLPASLSVSLASDECSTGFCALRKDIPAIEGSVTPGMLGGMSTSFSPNASTPLSDPTGKPKPILPPKKILKAVGQAIADWSMIEEGDRLLLGLSGGKDSLALLHILLHVQKKAPINFTLACATVDPQTESFDPSPLIPYVQSLGVPYHYLSEPIVEMAKSKLQGDSLCAFCSRFKRGLLYSCCRNNGYNKLILAQHLDDLAESFIMSSLHNGQIRTMKANYRNEFEGIEVNIIRPLVYVREADTRDFSLRSHLPVINENCPACFEQPKERARVKKLLSQEETMVPALFSNLRKALLPFMDENIYSEMKTVCSKIEERSKSSRSRQYQTPTSGTSDQKRSNKIPSGELTATDDIVVMETKTEGLQMDDRVEETARDEEGEGEEETERKESSRCEDGYCIPCYELA